MPARGFLDFTADAIGATPPGYTAAETRTGVTLTVEAEAGAGGGKVLRLQYVGASGAGFGRALYVYTGGPLSADSETVEIAARVRLTSIGGSAQAYTLGLRAEGVAGLFAALLAGTEKAAVYGYGGPSYGDAAFAWDPAVWYQLRMRAEGDTLTMLRMWADPDPEPGIWLVPAAATPAARNSGHLALALQFPLNSAGTRLDVDWIGWATGGGSAPLQALAPPVAGFTAVMDFVTVAVTSTAADPDGTLALIEYDFGAGAGWTTDTTYDYPEFGSYTITQRVTDSDGLQATDTLDVTTGSAGRATLAEYLLWASGRFVTHLDVQVERVIGGVPTFQSYRNFGGWNWIRSLRIARAGVDRGIGAGTLVLHRQRGAQSLAPLVTGSSLNQDGGSFAPALDFGREIKFFVAFTPVTDEVVTTAPAVVLAEELAVQALTRPMGAGSLLHFLTGVATVTADAAQGAVLLQVQPLFAALAGGARAVVSYEPAPEDWRQVFEGRTDDIAWGGKDSARVEVPFRDRSGVLAETAVRNATLYGDATPAEDVAQEIVDDWAGPGQYAIEVRRPDGWPSFIVTRYNVSEVFVWDALEKLADQAGAVWRQEWVDAAGEERLILITPPRDKTEPDYPVTPDTYLDVHQVSTGGKNLRNILRGYATDGTTGAEIMYQVPAEENVDDDPLVQLYGPRFMQLPQEDLINTEAELQAYIDSVYADVSEPPIPLEIETKYCWFAAVDQVVRWKANALLWDEDQDAAVLLLDDDFPSPGVARTRWHCGGHPKGHWKGWTRKGLSLAGRNARPASYYDISPPQVLEDQQTATHIPVGFSAGPGVTAVRGAALMFQDGTPNSDAAKAAVSNVAAAVTSPFFVPKPGAAPNFTQVLVQAGHVDATGATVWGRRWWLALEPKPAFAPRILLLDVDDQKVRCVGDHAASWTLTRLSPPVGGEYTASLDGAGVTFDLAAVIGSADVWEVEVRAYSDPIAERDGQTLSVAETRIVRGPTAPTADILQLVAVSAPAVGNDTVIIEVTTAAAPGHTMEADARWWLGSDPPGDYALAVATTPALATPGAGTQTIARDTGHTRAGGYADGSEVAIHYQVRIRVKDGSGNVVDSRAGEASWYIEAELPD